MIIPMTLKDYVTGHCSVDWPERCQCATPYHYYVVEAVRVYAAKVLGSEIEQQLNRNLRKEVKHG